MVVSRPSERMRTVASVMKHWLRNCAKFSYIIADIMLSSRSSLAPMYTCL